MDALPDSITNPGSFHRGDHGAISQPWMFYVSNTHRCPTSKTHGSCVLLVQLSELFQQVKEYNLYLLTLQVKITPNVSSSSVGRLPAIFSSSDLVFFCCSSPLAPISTFGNYRNEQAVVNGSKITDDNKRQIRSSMCQRCASCINQASRVWKSVSSSL